MNNIALEPYSKLCSFHNLFVNRNIYQISMRFKETNCACNNWFTEVQLWRFGRNWSRCRPPPWRTYDNWEILCKLAEGRFNCPSVNIKRGVSLWVDTSSMRRGVISSGKMRQLVDRWIAITWWTWMFFLNAYRLKTIKPFTLFRFCFLFHTWSVTALNKISHVRGF